jgi:hypothetical protein
MSMDHGKCLAIFTAPKGDRAPVGSDDQGSLLEEVVDGGVGILMLLNDISK